MGGYHYALIGYVQELIDSLTDHLDGQNVPPANSKWYQPCVVDMLGIIEQMPDLAYEHDPALGALYVFDAAKELHQHPWSVAHFTCYGPNWSNPAAHAEGKYYCCGIDQLFESSIAWALHLSKLCGTICFYPMSGGSLLVIEPTTTRTPEELEDLYNEASRSSDIRFVY